MFSEADFNKQLGKRLQNARKASKLTQSEAAVHFNMSQDTISKYERGLASVPAPRVLQFSKLYDRPVSFFFMSTTLSSK